MKSLAYNKAVAKVFLIISFFCFTYWIGAYLIGDIYRWALLGAIFEILWLPALAVMYLLPAFLLLLAMWNRFKIHKYYYFGLVILLVAIALLYSYFVPKYY